jgi:MFS family permease
MIIINQIKSIKNRIFYGWWVVASGSFLYGLGIGGVFYGFSTFFNPLINEFGWSRAALSGVFSLSRLEGGLEGLIVGPLIDRFGARKLAVFGIVWTGLGFITLILVNENILSLYLIFGLLLSFGYNAGFARPADAVAAKWFIRKRSRALSFVTAGGGLGGAVMVPLLAWLIVQYGWRSAAVIMGLVMLLLGLPAALLLRSTPEEKGFLPDGEPLSQNPEVGTEPAPDEFREQSAIADVTAGDVDFTVREALKTKAFWIFVAATMLRASVLSAIVVHQIPHLVDIGVDYQMAASVLGLMVLMSLPGRLIFGWIGDIFGKKYLLFICSLLQAVGMWIFIHADTVTMLYLFVVVYGLGYGGAIPLMHGFRADLFGRRIFATMMGISMAMTILPTVGAPILLGYLYDITLSYSFGFYVLLVLISLSGFVFLLIRQPKPPERLNQ